MTAVAAWLDAFETAVLIVIWAGLWCKAMGRPGGQHEDTSYTAGGNR